MMLIKNTHKKRSLALAVASMMLAPWALASDVNVSGFLSVGGGMVDDETSVPYDGYSEEDLTFDRNLLGLQVTGQVSERVSATAQLIARSENDYEVDAEWAYLSWQASDNGKVRAGRLRTPLYMYSDYLDVGYSYPWISAPNEVYYLPFNNVDGVDYYLTAALGSFDTSIQAYFGSFESDFSFEDGTQGFASLRNQMGVAATFGKDWWNFRAAYHQADLTVDVFNPTLNGFVASLQTTPFANLIPRIAIDDDKGTFAQVGLNIDTGMFVAAAEHVEFEVKETMLAKNIRDYVMVGLRFGDFLFHVTGSQADDEIAELSAGIPASAQTAVLIGTLDAIAAARDVDREVISFGTRWDVTSGTALKFQYDDVDDVKGEQKVYSVALQAVF
ncbi:DNA topoisomerase IV [Cellvibrio sp. KY-GH-1]|uniref:porin n=1 Tax=Cellvibrio sp. KY-GH-1 TaxID=2303332 RepID=UPI001247ABB6|nr:porin [Cellvibrio sp. KY-GH-1]QEY16678.1 DNA topoisomerase IV [Cellvibrio sp. KY-GH-1]